MSYIENEINLTGANDFGWVTKERFFDIYPSLSNLVKSPTLLVWGDNLNGALGDNTLNRTSSPVQTVAGGANWKQIAYGSSSSSAAIKTDGTLWMWGNNSFGQLGDNTYLHKSSPIQTLAGGTNWKQVSCGNNFSSAIKTDGTLWIWGYNQFGRLGTNDIIYKSSPVQTVAGGTNWKQVSCGYGSTGAIKTDGTLWTWGYNSYGQLGINSIVDTSSPIQTICGGTNWKYIAAGNTSMAAIKTDGTLWIWGSNFFGQLGDNTSLHKSSPVQTVAGGTNWKQIYVGVYSTASIKTDGTLWLWGSNSFGQLGDGTLDSKSSPVQTVAGGTNWKQTACGTHYSMAIKTDGTLWLWGRNNVGQLGDGTLDSKSSPVQTVAGANWKQVSSTGGTTLALMDDTV